MANDLQGKKILIFQQRNWGRGIGHLLAKKLQAEGCRLAALTLKRTIHEFVLNQKEVKYDLIIGNDEIMGSPKKYLGGENYSLQEICRELNVDSIWPIVSSMRNHVKSYKDKFYYSFRQNVPDEEIVDFVMATYKYIREFFREFKPDLVITPNFPSLPHLMFYFYAKKHGVPMIGITDSKVQGHFIFTHSYLDDQGPFFERLDELNNGRADSANRQRARGYIEEFRQIFNRSPQAQLQRRNWKQKIRRELSPFYHSLKWYLKPSINYLESTGITIDYRPPRIILRDHYARKRYEKFMNNYQYYPLEKARKFVYFPLQVQPEEAIDVYAPFFSNQIETARLVAQSLPDDYTLIVKDHPAMYGLHPPSYLEKIARTPNVKLVDYRIPSGELLRRADLVIGPSGTTLAEAPFFFKPVIQLGNLGTTLRLPTVFRHTDMTTLAAKIKEVLAMNHRTAENERRLENYVAAVYDTGFDYDYIAAWERGRGDKEELWQIYRREIEKTLSKDNR